MRIVLLGPPGAGKGSLALLYDARLHIVHLSTGEIFRREMARRSPLGRRVQRYVTSGWLVPDGLVIEAMIARLDPRTLRKGFVLDGFPRTKGQANGFDRVLRRQGAPLAGAVYLRCPPSLLIRRLSGRRVCTRCGTIYHLRTMRPMRVGRCDRCDGPLTIRKDDQPQTIRKRLAVDRKAAAALLAYYRRKRLLHQVDGTGPLETVYKRTLRLFRSKGWLAQSARS